MCCYYLIMLKHITNFLYKGIIEEHTFSIFGNIKFIVSKYFIILLLLLSILIIASLLNISASEVGKGIKPTTIGKILFICLIAPILEELIFRLPLVVSKTNLIISVSTFALFAYSFTRKYLINYEYIGYIAIFFIIIFSIYLLTYRYHHIYSFLTKNKLLLIHFSSLFFCTVHFGNYNFSYNAFVPSLMLLFTLIIGYYLSYIRLRFGIGYSIFAHSFHNILVSLPIIIKFITK